MWRKYSNGKDIFSFIFFLVLLAVVGYWGVMPLWAKATIMQKQSDELQIKLQDVQAFMVRHTDLVAYEATLKKQLIKVNNYLPDELALGAVLRGIEEAAGRCDIRIVALEALDREDNVNCIKIPLRLKAVGDYRKLMTFVKTLESAKYFSRVEIVKMKDESGLLHSELIVRYFVIRGVDKKSNMDKEKL